MKKETIGLSPVETARLLLNRDPIFTDTETTNMATDSEVIELALVTIKDEERFSPGVGVWRFNPIAEISEKAFEVHGISKEMLDHLPHFNQALWKDINRIARGRPVIAYNSDFDERLLMQTCQRYGLPVFNWEWFDLMELCARYFGPRWGVWEDSRLRRLSLKDCCEIAGIEQLAAHSAVDDAFVCMKLLEFIGRDGVKG